MDLRSTVILAAAIVVGFVLHALIQPLSHLPPSPPARAATTEGSGSDLLTRLDRLEDRSDISLDRTLLEHGKPRVLVLGGRELLYDPDWKRTGSNFTLTARYYELRDGSLIQVPTVLRPAPER